MSLFHKNDNVTDADFCNATEEEQQTIGQRITQMRKDRSYTQSEFAAMLDVTAQAVSKWENDISCPDIYLLPRIAEIFGITVDELLTGNKPFNRQEPENVTVKSEQPDESKLKLAIKIEKPGQKPINIALPFMMIKKLAGLGGSIASILGTNAVSREQIDQILSMIDEGMTGKLIDIVAEDETHVVIEVTV